ncbi:hypothetical protein R0K05_23470, partial [Planococcus sp. SIMBA_160]
VAGSCAEIASDASATHIEQLLYRSSLQYLLDFVFVLLCQANPERQQQLAHNLARVQQLLET